jgi:UDP-glucose 4-epimerase
MQVMVTGGAGFIGSHIADAFLARGDDVSVIDDLSAGRAGRVDPRATLHRCGILDAGLLTKLAEQARPQLICHLAAQIDVRDSVDDPAHDARVNVEGTVNVLEAARAVGARVVFASSGGALYGRGSPIPAPEDAPPTPESPYGVAKYCAERYVGLYNSLHGTTHAVLRLANVYGPRQDPSGEAGVIAIFCSRALAGEPPVIYGDGTQTRDYVYVGDVVRCFLAAAATPRAGTWHVGTGAEVSVLGLVEEIAGIAGRPLTPRFAPLRPGELQRSALSVQRAARDLDWHPVTGLSDGIRTVYRWIEAGAPERAGLQG